MGGGWWDRFNAKRQHLRRLAKRVGYPWPLTFEDPFVFQAQGDRWTNIDQLEAVVEFYWNFQDPWQPGARPLTPGDALYKPVSLRPPEGNAAVIVTGPASPTVRLDDGVDLSWVLPNPPNVQWTNSVGDTAPGNPAETTFHSNAPNYPAPSRYLYDTLWLEADTRRPKLRLYRIMSVDHQTVTLDERPVFSPGTTASRWKINRRPILVLIDGFGAREQAGGVLKGGMAVVSGHNAAGQAILTLTQDGPTGPAYLRTRVNKRFDTIYLARDTRDGRGLPFRTYRIVDATLDTTKVPPVFTVTVDGDPALDGASSPWHIPAGVGGDRMHTSNYNLAPANWGAVGTRVSRGYDHYDGAMFIVHDGKVFHSATLQAPFRWTSYTSRDYGSWTGGAWQEELSSIRGNTPYFFQGYRSPKAFINYSFSVVNINPTVNGITYDQADHVDTARFYFGTPQAGTDALDPQVAVDSNGKHSIRLHRGNMNGTANIPGSGSAGCQVSTESGDLRSALIQLYLKEYSSFHGPKSVDTFLDLIRKKHTLANEQLWSPWPAAAPVSSAEWDNKLAGVLWVIRPDEVPATPGRAPYP